MKKVIVIPLLILSLLLLLGCTVKSNTEVINTINTSSKTYSQMSDGTWQCDGYSYKYRLEISGRMNNATADSTFVYLSNIEEISFEQAWKAAGLGSNTNDYFSKEEAVLVDLK